MFRVFQGKCLSYCSNVFRELFFNLLWFDSFGDSCRIGPWTLGLSLVHQERESHELCSRVTVRSCPSLRSRCKSVVSRREADDCGGPACAKASLESIHSICPNLIALLAPGCVNIAMVLLYTLSWVVDDRERVAPGLSQCSCLRRVTFLVRHSSSIWQIVWENYH
jgi:hypothetical protein